MKENWIRFDEFIDITGIEKEQAKRLVTSGQISAKYIDNILCIDSVSGTNAIVKTTRNSLVSKSVDKDFVEQSIGTILSLHEKVVEAKDETILTIKNENQFLKDSLMSAQEMQIDDRKTIESLKMELETKKRELEVITRKYKLMWGRTLSRDGKI